MYAGRERVDGDAAIAEKVVTQKASRRIGQWAAQIASSRSKHVLIVHKANVLPLTQGLFRDTVRQSVERECVYVSERLVDIVAHDLVSSPDEFDVLVTTNMFGDILSDLAAYWCGGMGRAPSLNIGDELAIAEPVHGSAPDIAGQGIADPTATILSLSLLARYHWDDVQLANRIEQVVTDAIRDTDADNFSTDRFVTVACEAAQKSAWY